MHNIATGSFKLAIHFMNSFKCPLDSCLSLNKLFYVVPTHPVSAALVLDQPAANILCRSDSLGLKLSFRILLIL